MAKGPNPMTLVAGVIAIAAIGLSGYMFMQVNNMQTKLKEFSGNLPGGLGEEGAAGAGGHGDPSSTFDALFKENADVKYPLGEFTTNTADNKYAVMDLTLVIESTFLAADMEQYQAMLKVFESEVEYYDGWYSDKINKKTGEWLDKEKGHQASIPSGAINAAHAEKPDLPAPEKPSEPVRPMTVFEQELSKNDAKVRDNIINAINSHDSADIITPAGKEVFKKALIDGLNNLAGEEYGEVVDLYFNKLIVT